MNNKAIEREVLIGLIIAIIIAIIIFVLYATWNSSIADLGGKILGR